MEKIKFKSFFNSFSKEFIISVAIYKEDIWYKIITETGSGGTLINRIRECDALEVFNSEVMGIVKGLITIETNFTTHEA